MTKNRKKKKEIRALASTIKISYSQAKKISEKSPMDIVIGDMGKGRSVLTVSAPRQNIGTLSEVLRDSMAKRILLGPNDSQKQIYLDPMNYMVQVAEDLNE